MKHQILIEDQNGQVIFKGKLINLPMKSESIRQKCIELFNDDDPCIIHQSYAIAKFAEELLDILHRTSHVKTPLSSYAQSLDFINIPNLEHYLVTIEVK